MKGKKMASILQGWNKGCVGYLQKTVDQKKKKNEAWMGKFIFVFLTQCLSV